MNGHQLNSTNREAAVTGLAIVGFIALVAAGMWLAVYSARYMPTIANRIGAAAVSLSSVFGSDNGSPSLSVVSNASTTIPFGNGTSTSATSTPATSTPVSHPSTPSAGPKTSTTTAVGGTGGSLYGQPDLIVTISAVGYLTSSSTDSFVAATTVPHGATPAVKFTVKNVGTNVAGSWRFSASIPTTSNPIYQSIPQQSLNPGDYIDFTLGFTQPSAGSNQTISVTADFDHSVAESNENNNSTSASITILGS